MRKFLYLLCIVIAIPLASSCSQSKVKYRVGVSQCSDDIWRDKQNAELRMSAYFHDNVELKFAAAFDSDERQVQQIDSLVNEGIDLLIVAPNHVSTISPAIDRAYDKGIPVIVFERKTNSRKYTAFISAENYEMGRVMGEYIISRLKGKGRVLEIKGQEGSSPAIERHKGFYDAIRQAPGITLVDSLPGDWTEDTAYKLAHAWLSKKSNPQIDLIFGMNDRMAMGAKKAFAENHQNPLVCGIDALPGKNGGIQLVRDSLLDASYIYPTHGDQLLELALRILEGKPYEKETLLMSALVTQDNAKVLQMQSEETIRQSKNLDQLHAKADSYLRELGMQRVVSVLAFGVIVLLLLLITLFYLYYLRKVAFRRERVVNTLWNLQHEDLEPKTQSTEEETIGATTSSPSTPSPSVEENEPITASLFITRFKAAVEARLSESEITVEDLAADMNLSRAQLYRKVKAFTGSSPVELLRTARLNRAYQILLTTDKSVSEVAYAVGFTTPSYFTKCFKEEYGMVPGDVRK